MPDEPDLGGNNHRLPLFEPATGNPTDLDQDDDPSAKFVGRWNQLVSVSNWEKGRIIAQWRQALMANGGSANEYSDDAWAQRVGGVTGQHVGRLRRVYQRFSEQQEQFANLYWSHFHAAVEWDDAEMWLEGAVQNGWSVSQMRSKRWETLGAVDDLRPRDDEIVVSELDEDASLVIAVGPGEDHPADSEPSGPSVDTAESVAATTAGAVPRQGETGEQPDEETDRTPTDATSAEEKRRPERVRPFEDLANLPADVAEALERFKLAVLAHKLAGWQQISSSQLLDCLDALKELVLAPSE